MPSWEMMPVLLEQPPVPVNLPDINLADFPQTHILTSPSSAAKTRWTLRLIRFLSRMPLFRPMISGIGPIVFPSEGFCEEHGQTMCASDFDGIVAEPVRNRTRARWR